MTISIGLIIFIATISITVVAVFGLWSWFKKLKQAEGQYSKLDRALVPHARKKRPLTFLEKQWNKKGFKWYRVKIINENGLLYKSFSISEARFKSNGGIDSFTLKKSLGTYEIDETCLTFEQADIPYLTYVKDFPKPVKLIVPEKPKDKPSKNNNPTINVRFFSPINLKHIIEDTTVSQLVYDTDTEGLRQFMMLIGILIGINVFIGVLSLVVGIL